MLTAPVRLLQHSAEQPIAGTVSKTEVQPFVLLHATAAVCRHCGCMQELLACCSRFAAGSTSDGIASWLCCIH
jgi:hypothetical protein